MDSETADGLQDTNDTPIEEETTNEAPLLSLMTALDGDAVSQVAADQTTGTKQPRSLATIDDILVRKTQPQEDEDLADMFEEEVSEQAEEAETGVDNEPEESEEMTSAQATTTEPDTLDSMGGDEENTPEDTATHTHRLSRFPLSKMKRIMKMDPDTKLLSNEGVLLVAFSTELFIRALATASAREAVKSKRKTIKKEDVERCVNSLAYFEFLEDML